jgi:hypothetical protein
VVCVLLLFLFCSVTILREFALDMLARLAVATEYLIEEKGQWLSTPIRQNKCFNSKILHFKLLQSALVSIFGICRTNMKQSRVSIDRKLVPQLRQLLNYCWIWKEQCLLYMLVNFFGDWSSLKRIFELKCLFWWIGVESYWPFSSIRYSVATASIKRKFSENSNWTKEE